MADDRVHPHDSPHHHDEFSNPRPSPPSPEKPVPPPLPAGTYVIQIPKDQIYRVPPPENAARYKRLSHRSKRSRTCRCCCCFCCTFLVLIILLAIAAGVFYLVVRPESPKYSVNSVSIKGLNLTATASAASLSPEFNITVTANNPNDKIGIYYERDSSVVVYYNNVNLGGGVLPDFYQPTNNVTVFHTLLKGSAIELASSVHSELVSAEGSGTVPFKVKVRVPVKIKVGSVTTWTIKVKVDCDLTVDKVTSNSKIISKNCHYGVDLW